ILDWRRRYADAEKDAQLDEERAAKEAAQDAATKAEEREAHERRRARVFRSLLIGAVVLVLVAVAAVAFARVEKSGAERQATSAHRSAIQARQQANRAEATLIPTRLPDVGPVAAVLADVEASRLAPSTGALSGIRDTLQKNVGLPRILVGHHLGVLAVAFSRQQPWTLATGSSDGSVRL